MGYECSRLILQNLSYLFTIGQHTSNSAEVIRVVMSQKHHFEIQDFLRRDCSSWLASQWKWKQKQKLHKRVQLSFPSQPLNFFSCFLFSVILLIIIIIIFPFHSLDVHDRLGRLFHEKATNPSPLPSGGLLKINNIIRQNIYNGNHVKRIKR